MVESPEAYRWSSAAAHLKGPAAERIPLLDSGYWQSKGGGEAWKQLLEISEDVRELHRLRRATYSGAPWGSTQFIADMERQFERRWRVSGRPRKGQGKQEKGTERSASVSTA